MTSAFNKLDVQKVFNFNVTTSNTATMAGILKQILLNLFFQTACHVMEAHICKTCEIATTKMTAKTQILKIVFNLFPKLIGISSCFFVEHMTIKFIQI